MMEPSTQPTLEPPEPPISGIGGLLLVFVIFRCMDLLAYCIRLPGTIRNLTYLGDLPLAYAVMLALQTVLGAACIGVLAAAVANILRKRYSAIRLYTIHSVLNILTVLASTALYIMSDLSYPFMRILIFQAIALAYLYKSERVRNTLVH